MKFMLYTFLIYPLMKNNILNFYFCFPNHLIYLMIYLRLIHLIQYLFLIFTIIFILVHLFLTGQGNPYFKIYYIFQYQQVLLLWINDFYDWEYVNEQYLGLQLFCCVLHAFLIFIKGPGRHNQFNDFKVF